MAIRTNGEKERDYNFITEMYLKGYSCRVIAARLCEHVKNPKYLTYRQVNNDINAILKQWHNDRITDINKQKTIELEKIHKLEQEYWRAWEKSIEDFEKKSKKLKGSVGLDRDGKPKSPSEQEISTTEMISMGNPAYLAGIERCIERRCKILGIDAPQKMDVTSGGEKIKGITVVEVVHTSREELEKSNEDAGDSGIQPDKGGVQRKPV